MYCLTLYVKTGDVVLIRGGAKHSKIIAALTRGPFSHAGLIVGDSQIIEALGGGGVQYTSSLKFLVDDKANIAVLRPRFLCGDQADEIRATIEDIAKGYQSKQYNLEDALKSLFKRKKPTQQNKFFCSQLVSAIYRAAGWPLSKKKDHNVTPNDLWRNTKVFEDVTEHAITILPDNIAETLAEVQQVPIDRGGETVSDTALLFQAFVRGLDKVFHKYGLDAPVDISDVIDVLTDPSNSKIAAQLDADITQVFDALKIIEKLTPPDDPIEIDMEALTNAIAEKGLPYIQSQLFLTRKSFDRFQKKNAEIEGYMRAYGAATTGLRLSYAGRMVDYYSQIIRNSIAFEDILSEKIEILEEYERVYLQ